MMASIAPKAPHFTLAQTPSAMRFDAGFSESTTAIWPELIRTRLNPAARTARPAARDRFHAQQVQSKTPTARPAPPMPATPSVYSVAELNRRVQELLQNHLSDVAVRGEISGLKRYPSGHWYFTLKDRDSEISCAMFARDNRRLAFRPQDGDAVLAQARVDLYVKRGRYQLVVQSMSPEGQGALLQRLEALKSKLKDEGLFDPARKRPLPDYPTAIGIVTSPESAALRDVARALRRRWPVAKLYVYAAAVQGAEAPHSLCQALERAGRARQCDVLILARGGGSIEDLLAFSDEAVVRAVAACPLPLISGIGHETDTTLADFAADVRAATPTAAAEQASPDGAELEQESLRLLQRLQALAKTALRQARRSLDDRRRRLEQAHPAIRFQAQQQQTDDAAERLTQALRRSLQQRQQHVELLNRRLAACTPQSRLAVAGETLRRQRWQLHAAMRNRHHSLQARLGRAETTLNAVSPLRTLDRGYAIAMLRTPDGPRLLRESRQAHAGDTLELRLRQGRLEAEVTKTEAESPPKA